MKTSLAIEVYSNQADVLGEGPIWSVSEQALYWLDIAQRRLYRRAPGDTQARRTSLAGYAGCLAEIAPGTVAVAMGEGIHRLNVESGTTRLLCERSVPRMGTRFNDGKVDPRGRFWVGTMQNNFGPQGQDIPVERSDGTLFRFDPDGRSEALEEHIGVPNTLAWSPDERHFYFADSVPGCIYVYDYDGESGRIGNRQILFHASESGTPDGSAVDVDGCLWNARWDGGALLRITPEGTVDQRVELPVPRPTSCIFGGPHFETLFVTSARIGLSAAQLAEFPLSGCVFAIHGAAQGFAVPPFAGPWL